MKLIFNENIIKKNSTYFIKKIIQNENNNFMTLCTNMYKYVYTKYRIYQLCHTL